MANFDVTAEAVFSDSVSRRGFVGRRRIVERLYRRTAAAKACSGFGLLGFARAGSVFENICRTIPQPTTKQFAGTVAPAGAREVTLCKYDSNTVSPVVLETMSADANGDFACNGWYKPEPTGRYFYRIAGDTFYSTKDFPVLPPVVNEWKWPVDHGSPADTSVEFQQQYVDDSFTDTEGTPLTSHTPILDVVGTGWELVTANAVNCGIHADSGRGVAYTVSGATAPAVIDAGTNNVLIQCYLVFGDSVVQSAEHGIVLRYVDSSNYLRIVISNADTTAPRFSVISKVAGVDTTIYTIDFPYDTGPFLADKFYVLKAVAYGSKVAVDFYNNNWFGTGRSYQNTFQFSDKNVTDHQTATKHGIYIGGNQMYVDDFKIWSV